MSYAQYIGFYDESYIQFHVRRIEANNQKEAEEKFMKHLERVNCIADPNKIYVDLTSNIDIIGFPKTALNPYPYFETHALSGRRILNEWYDSVGRTNSRLC